MFLKQSKKKKKRKTKTKIMDNLMKEKIKAYQKSPLLFISEIWKLNPERDNSKFIK